MNEVGFSQLHGSQVPRINASSTDTVAEVKKSAIVSPTTEAKNKPAEHFADQPLAPIDDVKALGQAIDTMTDYVQSIQRDLQFSVDEDLDQTVVKVIDSDSGDIIRQIPGDFFLELARNLKEGGEVRLVDALG